VHYNIELTDIGACLRDVRPLMEPLAQARDINFSLDVACDGTFVRVDQDRLCQILLNLVHNAVKFTPAGGAISVRCAPAAESVVVEVADTGCGIPADKLDTIFDPFVQIDRRNSRPLEKGVGLGLAISRDLARGMGGELTVISDVGAGSTFTLTLPSNGR
jgi:signal transduction histidine kinase